MKLRYKSSLDRRDFLNVLGSTAVAAAGAGGCAEVAWGDSESNDEKRKPRYRESEEVKTFYRVNRYPS